MWKMALKDGYKTTSKFWAAIAEDLKPLLYRKTKWTEEMRHYALWLLYSPRRVAALYAGGTPVPSTFKVDKAERSAVVKIIAQEMRRSVQRLPRVRVARRVCFDADMYTLETTSTRRQQIALMGLTPAARVRVPLLGRGAISGNIRLVLEPRTHSAGGSCRQRVNPAYSSQTCPQCGYVHAGNRNGDKFVCLFCGWVGHSDRVGAHNLRNRMDDPDIALWMPKDRVRTVLLNRFSQRTGEIPDWKPKGDCSGVDSRHQVTTAGRAVGAETQVGGDGGMVRPVAVIDHPGQLESETAKEILAGGTTRPAVRYDAATERGKTVAKRTRS